MKVVPFGSVRQEGDDVSYVRLLEEKDGGSVAVALCDKAGAVIDNFKIAIIIPLKKDSFRILPMYSNLMEDEDEFPQFCVQRESTDATAGQSQIADVQKTDKIIIMKRKVLTNGI